MSAWHEKYRSLLAGDGFERFTEGPGLGFLRVGPDASDAWDHAPDERGTGLPGSRGPGIAAL